MRLFARLILTLLLSLVPFSSFALRVNVLDRSNFTADQSQKLDQAVTVLNQVLNSPDFKTRILNFTWNGKTEFVQNNGLSNQLIYDALMAGAEQFPSPTVANQLADMNLTIYYPSRRHQNDALAFTSPSDPFLHLYNNYYESAETAEISNTLIHEWTHKLGFDHDFDETPERPFSVPYGVGNIVQDLVQKFINP